MSENLQFNFITEYLKNRTADNSLESSHTALGDKKLNIFPGKYAIVPSENEYFLKLYCNWIFKYEHKLYLTEKHNSVKCPVLIDLDFRYECNGAENRVYSDDDILFFIDKYLQIISTYLDITDSQKETFIMEKSKPVAHESEKDIMKDGVHIIIPNIVTTYDVLHLVRNDIINDKEVISRFENLGFINPISDIVDKAVIEKNNWFMYGSQKPGKEPYFVTKIIDCEKDKLTITEGKKNYTNEELVILLGINNKLEENTCKFKKLKSDITQQYEAIFGKPKRKGGNQKVNKKYIKTTTENLEIIKKLISILSLSRAETYSDWIRLGWCLHNIDYTLLGSWIEFSSQSPKFEEGVCEEKWIEMKDEGGLEVGTLFRWAKIDNPTAYRKIMQGDIESLIKGSLNKCHYDIAKVIYRLFKHEFKCVSSKNKLWYRFNNHRWHEMDNAVELKKRISEEVVQEYCNYAAKCNTIIQETNDESQQEMYIQRGKSAYEISIKLRDNNFRKNIIDCCVDLFHDKKFFEKLDSNVNLIGFENGVYDLENKVFREGYPDDYISFSAKIDYEEYCEDNDIVKTVHKFISQVLPIPEVKTYILRNMGYFLSGKTGEEKFHIWTGCGGNGKSKLIELFENCFGDYCGKMPVTVITRPRAESGKATPEILINMNKRFVTLQEPDHNEKIHVGAMKELTGGDKIQVRGLFKEPVEFKPQWKIVMTSNVLPEVSSNERGTWRRLRVTEYISRFVENTELDDTIPYQFPIDYNLSAKLEEWKEAFMWILIQEYHKYEKDGKIYEPKEVTDNTKAYQEESDVFLQFMNDNINVSVQNKLTTEEVNNVFKVWFQNSGIGGKPPNKKDLHNNITQKYGPPKKNVWKGITIMDNSDDYEDEEEED